MTFVGPRFVTVLPDFTQAHILPLRATQRSASPYSIDFRNAQASFEALREDPRFSYLLESPGAEATYLRGKPEWGQYETGLVLIGGSGDISLDGGGRICFAVGLHTRLFKFAEGVDRAHAKETQVRPRPVVYLARVGQDPPRYPYPQPPTLQSAPRAFALDLVQKLLAKCTACCDTAEEVRALYWVRNFVEKAHVW